MNLEELLMEQYGQQRELMGPLPADRAERKLLAQRFSTYMMEEIFEYLRAASYKHFLKDEELPRETRVLELVDALKFLLCIMWTEGVSAEELESLFLSKTEAVRRRHQEWQAGSKICGFDIDGVLANLPTLGGKELDNWFNDGGALTVEPLEGAREALAYLKTQGWGIVLVTARKLYRHRRLEYETHHWLQHHEIPYDRLLWGYDKAEALAKERIGLRFFVEDHPKHAIDLARAGVDVLLLRSEREEVRHERIRYVENLGAVVEIAQQLYNGAAAE